MPIKPENKLRYPADWKNISLRIRERANWHCECLGECGIQHPSLRCDAIQNGQTAGGKRVILTVAHLDHTPENCAEDNLKAMCQRCHLRYDRDHHACNAAKTRRAKLASGDLIDGKS